MQYNINNTFECNFLMRYKMALTKRGDNAPQVDELQDDETWEIKPEVKSERSSEESTNALREAFAKAGISEPNDIANKPAQVVEQEVPASKPETVQPQAKINLNNSVESTEQDVTFSGNKQMTNFLNASIQASTTEDIEKFVENLTSVVKQLSPAAGITGSVNLIDHPSAACKVIAITGRTEQGKFRTYSLLLEKGAKPLPTKTFGQGADSHDVPLTLNHAWTESMHTIINNFLATSGVTGNLLVDYMIVDNRFDLTAARVAGIIGITAMLRIGNDVNNLGSINLSELVKEGKELRNVISIAPGMTDTNILGQEVASDVVSIINAVDSKVNDNNNKMPDLNAGEGQRQLLKTNAILDALIVEPELTGSAHGITQTSAIIKPALFATNIEGISEASTEIAEDTKSVLLAVAGLIPFAEKDQYKQIINQHVRGSGKASVGVIGMYHNCDPANSTPPGEIKVAETDARANAKLSSPLSVARDYFVQGMPVIGIDVIEGSRMASAARLLVQAAGSDERAIIARRKVMEHIDNLGNGGFSQAWGTKPFITALSTLVDGVIDTGDGNTASSQSFDNWQAMAVCGGNAEQLKRVLVNGGEDTMTPRFIANRIEQISAVASFTVKAYGTRYFFTREFVEAFIAYLRSSNVDIKYDGIAPMYDNTLSGGFNAESFNTAFGGGFSNHNNFSGGSGSSYGFKYN